MKTSLTKLTGLVLCNVTGLALAAPRTEPARFVLTREGQPACTLVASPKSELQRRAVQAIVDGVREVSGVTLPVETAPLPPEVGWVLVQVPAPGAARSAAFRDALRQARRESARPAGFAVRRYDHAVVLRAADERTAYHGSVYCRDTLLKVQGPETVIEEFPALASPLAVRGSYHLTCWGRSPEYQLKDYKTIFDAWAEDGMNADYFWLCGLFRSQKCPQAFDYPVNAPTTAEIRELVAYAHSIGVDFYLGSGVFAWFGLDSLANAHPETKAVGATVNYRGGGMCPSNPLSRKLNLDYLTEMYDAFPDADGMFLEIRDEYGPCECARCQAPDPAGGTHYAEAELSFLQELTAAVWKKHPRARFVWCIGYSEGNVHAADKAYYEHLTRRFNDPRFQWLVVRQNWALPAADGQMHPLAWFSPNMLHWSEWYGLTVDQVRDWVRKMVQEHLLGAVPPFEPGYNSCSFYGCEIPFPVDTIPFVITRFACRTYAWEPELPLSAFRERVYRKFFTPEIAPELADDILWLFDFARSNSSLAATATQRGNIARELKTFEGTDTAKLSAPEKTHQIDWLRVVTKLTGDTEPRLRAIETRLAAQQPVSARSKRGLAMMRRCTDDIRTEFLLTPEGQARLKAIGQRLAVTP